MSFFEEAYGIELGVLLSMFDSSGHFLTKADLGSVHGNEDVHVLEVGGVFYGVLSTKYNVDVDEVVFTGMADDLSATQANEILVEGVYDFFEGDVEKEVLATHIREHAEHQTLMNMAF